MFDRVVEKVDEHLLDEATVSPHHQQFFGQPHLQSAAGQAAFDVVYRDFYDLFQRGGLIFYDGGSALYPRQAKNVLHDVVKPLRVVVDRQGK